jgi:hypothetical protein
MKIILFVSTLVVVIFTTTYIRSSKQNYSRRSRDYGVDNIKSRMSRGCGFENILLP